MPVFSRYGLINAAVWVGTSITPSRNSFTVSRTRVRPLVRPPQVVDVFEHRGGSSSSIRADEQRDVRAGRQLAGVAQIAASAASWSLRPTRPGRS